MCVCVLRPAFPHERVCKCVRYRQCDWLDLGLLLHVNEAAQFESLTARHASHAVHNINV